MFEDAMILAIIQLISGALGFGLSVAYLVTRRKHQRLVQLAGAFILTTAICSLIESL
jgi:hypothetical protein